MSSRIDVISRSIQDSSLLPNVISMMMAEYVGEFN
jgi:hypothetical protein